jgi:flagellar protein FliO/FliZ
MSLRPAFMSAAAAALGCLLTAPAALAAGGESTPLNLPADSGSAGSAAAAGATGGGGLVRTIVGLAVVIGVIYGLYWVLKQVKSAREEKASGQGLAPLASLPLGGNRSLQLVRAGQEIVLVGVGEHGVTPARTYTEEEALRLGPITPDEEPAPDAPAAERPTLKVALTRGLDDLRRRTVIR